MLIVVQVSVFFSLAVRRFRSVRRRPDAARGVFLGMAAGQAGLLATAFVNPGRLRLRAGQPGVLDALRGAGRAGCVPAKPEVA